MEDRIPFDELGLSNKAYNYLKQEGVYYIDEVQVVLDKIRPTTLLAMELNARLRVWRGYGLAVAKIEVAIKALEDLMRDEWDDLDGGERRAVAETADALRIEAVRLRDRHNAKG
jgi:ABC-type uncharacterized transport system ATPase component